VFSPLSPRGVFPAAYLPATPLSRARANTVGSAAELLAALGITCAQWRAAPATVRAEWLRARYPTLPVDVLDGWLLELHRYCTGVMPAGQAAGLSGLSLSGKLAFGLIVGVGAWALVSMITEDR
jgi:hypothetical protein